MDKLTKYINQKSIERQKITTSIKTECNRKPITSIMTLKCHDKFERTASLLIGAMIRAKKLNLDRVILAVSEKADVNQLMKMLYDCLYNEEGNVALACYKNII